MIGMSKTKGLSLKQEGGGLWWKRGYVSQTKNSWYLELAARGRDHNN